MSHLAESDDPEEENEDDSVIDRADDGKVLTMHLTRTPPLSPFLSLLDTAVFLSLLDTAVSVCRNSTVLLRAAVCKCRLHQSQSNPPFMYMQF